MINFKRNLTAACAIFLSILLHITPSYAAEGKNVFVQGKLLSVQSVQEGVPMIPADEFCKAMGAQFSYNHSNMMASIRKDNILVDLALDNAGVAINGKAETMPAPMKIANRRIMLPMEYIAKVFGHAVYFDSFQNRWLVLKKEGSNLYYTVESGDTLWKLSVTFNTTVAKLMGDNQLSDTMLRIGQKLKVAAGLTTVAYDTYKTVTKTSATLFASKSLSATAKGYLKAWTEVTILNSDGLWYEAATPIGNGYLYQSVLSLPQGGVPNMVQSTYFQRKIPVDTSKNTVKYSNYTVKSGDTLWSIAVNKGTTMNELAAANNIPTSAWLNIGQVLKIPQRIIVAEDPVRPGYGKLADWFEQGNYILPLDKEAVVIDQETGKSFRIRRTMGASHADVETLTAADTKIYKEIFGGSWSWNRRAAYLEVDGNRYAISIAGMPHAGLDNQPYLADVSGRSDNWGYGPNYDAIKGNGMDGHFDLYFLNSLRHKDNQIDPEHQKNILKAAGLH